MKQKKLAEIVSPAGDPQGQVGGGMGGPTLPQVQGKKNTCS